MTARTARMEIAEGTAALLADYALVSIAYEVTRVVDVEEAGPVGDAPASEPRFRLIERPLAQPYLKNYDSVAGDAPSEWAGRFDLARWRFFLARIDGQVVGAAAVAFDTPTVDMLEGRRDLAQLWDIRVAPDARGRGVGEALFRAAERWAAANGCRELKVETQNVNVPACRFYERQGCQLRVVNRGAYPDLGHEMQLLWYKDLTPREPNPK
ncbi:MAG TPA: GNAT family N-acetyltransferase [Candidatus Eisenbacteria bacterium]|nr:GNAT family N-acetyltransferase [Candidatus Eisenbacteria bacterium]